MCVNLERQVSGVATSSILNTVRIEGEREVKKFVAALEKAEKLRKNKERDYVPYQTVRGKDIVELLKKSK